MTLRSVMCTTHVCTHVATHQCVCLVSNKQKISQRGVRLTQDSLPSNLLRGQSKQSEGQRGKEARLSVGRRLTAILMGSRHVPTEYK